MYPNVVFSVILRCGLRARANA